MADIFSSEKRSEIMSKITGKETKPEVLVRRFLFAHGFRFRKNDKRYPGKPDIILPKYKTAVFVNGCFWHGHRDCKKSKLPETNRDFWETKINRTIERDKRNIKDLEDRGWKALILWQCELDKESKFIWLIEQLNSI